MANAYIFHAALWCGRCIAAFKAENVKPAHVDESDESSYDSAEWPKGPYGEGGGEADCPQHCDGCGEFLENLLTPDGERYVVDAIRDGSGAEDVLQVWRSAYDYLFLRPASDADIGGDEPSSLDTL